MITLHAFVAVVLVFCEQAASQSCNVFSRTNVPLGGYCRQTNYVALINFNNFYPQGCSSPTNPNYINCPSGYTCTTSSSGQALCCGPLGRCPNRMTQMYDSNQCPLPCGGLRDTVCQRSRATGQCVQSTGGAYNQYLCCDGAGGGGGIYGQPICPGNLVPSSSEQCSAFQPRCSLGGSCSRTIVAQPQFACCPQNNNINNARCQNGGNVLRLGGVPQQCVNLNQPCQGNGYFCEQSTISNVRICCSGTRTREPGSCPNNGQRFGTTVCRDDYDCNGAPRGRQFICAATSNGVAWCCENLEPGSCPNNGQLTGNSRTACSSNRDCPTNSNCVRTNNGIYGCCTGGGTNRRTIGRCPSGRSASSQQECISDQECRRGFVCDATSNGVKGCCSDSIDIGRCPNNGQIDANYGICANDNECLLDYFCETTTSGAKACCKSGTPNGQDCPDNRLGDRTTGGAIRTCNKRTPSCRSGYECVDSPDRSRSLCCRGPRCRDGVTIGSGPDGGPIDCTGDSQCPNRGRCEESLNIPGRRICCSFR